MSLAKVFQSFKEGFDSVMDIAENKLEGRMRGLERRIGQVFARFKRRIYKSVFEMVFWILSVVLLFGGLSLFLSRFFPLDLVIIGFGLLSIYIALIVRMIK